MLKYLIDSQNAGYSIHCSYFSNEKVVIELAVVEKGDHHKKVIMSSYLNIYAPDFLLFFLSKNPFSYLFGWVLCWATWQVLKIELDLMSLMNTIVHETESSG